MQLRHTAANGRMDRHQAKKKLLLQRHMVSLQRRQSDKLASPGYLLRIAGIVSQLPDALKNLHPRKLRFLEGFSSNREFDSSRMSCGSMLALDLPHFHL